MIRVLIFVIGGLLLLNFIYPNHYGSATAPGTHASATALRVNTPAKVTDVQIGTTKAKFELIEDTQAGHLDGYTAKLISSKGKTLINLPVTKTEGKKLYAWAQQHHVFRSAGSFLSRAAIYLAEI